MDIISWVRTRLLHFLALGGLAFLPAAAGAQENYPDRPIMFYVGSSPGGAGSTSAQLLATYLEKYLGPGATITVLNKPGASGQIAYTELASQPADGYSIGFLNVPNVVTQVIEENTAFTLDDFTYLGKVFGGQASISVGLESQFETLEEVVSYAKENPKLLTLGVGGLGADDHLLALQFAKLAGIELTIVPMGGDALARNAVMGGHVALGSMSLATATNFKDTLRILGTMAPERLDFAEDVPTFREQGFDIVGGNARLLAAPANMPAEVTAKLSEALRQAIEAPEFQAEAKKQGHQVEYLASEEATSYVKAEYETLKALWESDPW